MTDIGNITLAAIVVGCAWAVAWWAVNESREHTKRDANREETYRASFRAGEGDEGEA